MSFTRPSPLCPVLSIRQVEVVQLVARGLGTKDIAKELGISISSALNHVSRIYEKLGLFSREQLTVWALQKGLLHIEGIKPKLPSYSLPQSAFVCEMRHKYKKGEKVRVTNHNYIGGWPGVITGLMPYTFIAPAYYVLISGVTSAVSERSLERIEEK